MAHPALMVEKTKAFFLSWTHFVHNKIILIFIKGALKIISLWNAVVTNGGYNCCTKSKLKPQKCHSRSAIEKQSNGNHKESKSSRINFQAKAAFYNVRNI